MEEVTDFAFREMFARYSGYHPLTPSYVKRGNNDFVLFTEFVNVDGIMHEEGRKKLLIDLKYSERQRPIVVQLWGSNPEKFYEAAQFVTSLGFDGIDINMGCPQSKEIAIGACAALIREPKLAQEIILATKKGSRLRQACLSGRQGFGGQAGDLPVSVKTRIGYSKPEEMGEWVKIILETEPAALILHGRTKKEMSKVPAHWDKIKEAVEIRDQMESQTLIVGNGDIKSYQEGIGHARESGVDGIMAGRGAFGYPWFFRADDHLPDVKECLRAMLEHADLFEQTFAGKKSFVLMRKHFKAYVSGFDGAHELRAKLMQVKDIQETRKFVEDFLQKFSTPS